MNNLQLETKPEPTELAKKVLANEMRRGFGRKRRKVIGVRFGKLVVVKYAGRTESTAGLIGKLLYRCQCDCGATKVIRSNNLRSLKGTRSCGCLHHENAVLQGQLRGKRA